MEKMVKNVYKKSMFLENYASKNVGKREAKKKKSSVCKLLIKIEILTLQVAFHDKLFK